MRRERITSLSVTPVDEKKMRVLLLCSHPTQYSAPMWRRVSQHPGLETLVAYCSLEGAQPHVDKDFGVEVTWDIPLLDGYRWVRVKNFSPRPRAGSFWGLFNPGIWRLIRKNHFDAITMFTGYMCATFWIALAAAKVSGTPVLYGTDATGLWPQNGKRWKVPIKKQLLPAILGLADVVIAPSEATRQFVRDLGIQDTRIALTPFVVDNDWWLARAAKVEKAEVRRTWAIPEAASVVLFCAKLQPWKRPLDVLRAFLQANLENAYLVFAGDGPLRDELEQMAKSSGALERVRFLGFVNQSELPGIYSSSDIFVLSSDYDACPVVVCEAMLCGCPVVLSDRIRGRFDLVKHGETGFIYPCGNTEALATTMSEALRHPQNLRAIRRAARDKMSEWSPEYYVQSFSNALRRANLHQWEADRASVAS